MSIYDIVMEVRTSGQQITTAEDYPIAYAHSHLEQIVGKGATPLYPGDPNNRPPRGAIIKPPAQPSGMQ